MAEGMFTLHPPDAGEDLLDDDPLGVRERFGCRAQAAPVATAADVRTCLLAEIGEDVLVATTTGYLALTKAL